VLDFGTTQKERLEMKFFTLFLIVLSTSVFSTEVTKFHISTERGDQIEAKLHTPKDMKEKVPALIIGPGQGYHMDLPLVKILAEKAAQNKIISLRFNWNYFTNGKRPSTGLVNEIQDMAAALDYLKKHPQVDRDKIMISGKSLGTLVAYQSFKKDQSLFSLYLLTPLCTWHWDENDNEVTPFPVGEVRYPNLNNEKRPVHLTLGNSDPLCFPNMLYDFLKASKGNISVSVFGGNHSMNIGRWDDPVFEERNAANIDAATDATIHWMNLHLNK
jgi:predicted esterase